MAKKNVQPVESDVEIITPDAKNKQLKNQSDLISSVNALNSWIKKEKN